MTPRPPPRGLGPTCWAAPIALAALLAPGCAPAPPQPQPPPAQPPQPPPSQPPTSTPAAPARQEVGVTLTIFAGFAGAPARPPELPRFAPLDDVFAACPAVRAVDTVRLPRAADATTALALPDGGRADARWEDPAKLRLLVAGVPRAKPGATLTYQLTEAGRTVMFWGPTGARAADAPCAYVVVGDGTRDH